jgi:uncharacterized protein (TIGR02266 family)
VSRAPDSHIDDVAAARDTLLLELLLDVGSELSGAQLYLVRGRELRGHLACDDDGIDDRGVRHRRLPLSLLSVACRTVNQGIPYFGPVPPTDPCAALVAPEVLAEQGLALLPLRLGERAVALLLGHPRRAIDRALRDVLCVLVHDAASGLGKLIADARQRRRAGDTPAGGGAKARQDASPPQRTQHASSPSRKQEQHDDNDEGLGDDTIDDAMQREPAERPVYDVGRGSDKPRKRRKTLSGHPGAQLIFGSQELPAPVLPKEPAPAAPAAPAALAAPAPAPAPASTPAPTPASTPAPAVTPAAQPADEGPVFLLTRKKRTAENELDDPFDEENFRTGTYVAPETRRAAGAERREHTRTPLNVEVHVQRTDGRFETAFMEDISVGGMFIASGAPPQAGERVDLTFSLPGVGGEVRVRSEVRWVRPGASASGLAGVGLRFVDLPGQTRDRVAAFVATQE